MKKSIRWCISCILPCGSLDLIRVVHSNGRVEEFDKKIRARDLMKAYPKHVVRRSPLPSDEGILSKIIIMLPNEELQRGKIYFLLPVSSLPTKSRPISMSRIKKNKDEQDSDGSSSGGSASLGMTKLLISDQYLTEMSPEKVSTQKDLRRGRIRIWRPHLTSISETPIDL